jgi:hypothetical protein
VNFSPVLIGYRCCDCWGSWDMPIGQFITGELGSADINRLDVAYATTLRMLDLTEHDDPISDIVAKKVIDVATSGVTDPQEIADAVIGYFLRR